MKKFLGNLLIVVLVVVGLGLVFNSQITSWWVGYQGGQKASSITKQEAKRGNQRKGDYNFSNVKAVDENAIMKSTKAKQSPAIGRIKIPDLKVDLPIFKGLNDDDLTIGAGTMKMDEKMGEKNYVLAGHHMKNPDVLFSPLSRAKVGQKIYLSNPSKKYTYKITSKKIVSENDISVINDNGNQKEITLVTCASGNPGETRRLIVSGELVKS
ncbi:class A sortase [Fructilactobacillus fructivorans]|uniref:Sortase A, LPXTG specific n=1 Tax=Fructilactobacillus fructivorans TaxID=1614 RepID=A0A0C1PNR4_9LACO|nr:class A sortase [Fructilactobacillus fructivorans]KID42382.1 Sortase A, LPXTG specific [Fructilactobacillus fructivorans]MCT0151001.1 class A sortase [Fructilactobacillus fructivorans]MCT2867441.1 class A sortase [Fructilactobacillus fructivorans]MCT2869040.1 class A sortase [Fructilactobacillus fructivorans]MCT2873240.1 class A sortase [Fructilactobacillus fructivorans]